MLKAPSVPHHPGYDLELSCPMLEDPAAHDVLTPEMLVQRRMAAT